MFLTFQIIDVSGLVSLASQRFTYPPIKVHVSLIMRRIDVWLNTGAFNKNSCRFLFSLLLFLFYVGLLTIYHLIKAGLTFLITLTHCIDLACCVFT